MAMTTSDDLRAFFDRQQISELLNDFAYYLDTKQWAQWIDLFDDDGVLALPAVTKDKQTLAADGGPRGLMDMHATHHISSNHRIDVDGDTATANSYVQATHVPVADAADQQWVLGGWYDTELRRTGAGWKIVRNTLTKVWS
jgi:3-phenylpropionate/cinnamic acid dioxygenase small subunit